MRRGLISATTIVCFFGGAGWSPARAGSVPADYFVEGISAVAVGDNSLPEGWDGMSPVPGITTGQIAGPSANITSPATATYYHSGINTDGDGPLVAGGISTAAASLIDGKLHAAAGPISASDLFDLGGFPAAAYAEFGETLSFTTAGAEADTITTVKYKVHLDGVLGDCCTIGGSASVLLWLALGDPLAVGGAGYPGGFNPQIENIDTSGSILEQISDGPRTVDETLEAQFTYRGSTAKAGLYMVLGVEGQYQNSVFNQTATFSFDPLPDGVSFTSASGNFLTTPAVPEPMTWALVALGFAGLGFAGNRRAKNTRAAMVTG